MSDLCLCPLQPPVLPPKAKPRKPQNLPCLPHLRDWRIHHGVIEEFHHHKLFQSHQVFLVGLIDALIEAGEQIQVTGEPRDRETACSST